MKIKTVHRLKLPYQYKIKGLNWILNRVTSFTENQLIRRSKVKGCILKGANEMPVIVSLTTYPARNKKVQWTVKSLLNQSVKIDRLILWLADTQYPGREIPSEIARYIKYGLDVRFCNDIKSHKKYFYVMQENPEAVVITADDDVIYPEDTVEKLLEAHKKYPDAVICNQGRYIKTENGDFAPYKMWTINIPKTASKPDYRILPIGEGGVLYPPAALDPDAFCRDSILNFAPTADDLWLKFMAVKNERKAAVSCKIQRAPCEVSVKELNDGALNHQNIFQGKNDQVIELLKERYTIVLEKIIKNL